MRTILAIIMLAATLSFLVAVWSSGASPGGAPWPLVILGHAVYATVAFLGLMVDNFERQARG